VSVQETKASSPSKKISCKVRSVCLRRSLSKGVNVVAKSRRRAQEAAESIAPRKRKFLKYLES